MVNIGFLFSVSLVQATSSIYTMQMLADQARENIELAIKKAHEPGAIREFDIPAYRTGDDGEPEQSYPERYYSYGPCYQDNEPELLMEYEVLVAQLNRRSALLTIYGLFEYGIKEALKLMKELSKDHRPIGLAITKQTHQMLTKVIQGKVKDVKHINTIRNIMAHNDGIVDNKYLGDVKRAEKENADVDIIFGRLQLGDNFLEYLVAELSRYLHEMVDAIQVYHKKRSKP